MARSRFRLLAAGLASGCALLAGGTAGAAPLPVTTCLGTTAQAFLFAQDTSGYTLAPGGSFESGAAGWTLAGGAATAAGNEPWYVNAPTDSRSLALPAGSSATTPSVCVGALDATIRFFASGPATTGSSLRVSVAFTLLGQKVTMPVGTLKGTGAWQASAAIPFLANVLSLFTASGTSQVAFQFSALSGNWRIDDVYVDPLKHK